MQCCTESPAFILFFILLFFVSKAGDIFEMESGALCWSVDNLRGDTAVLAVDPRQGTRLKGRLPKF